MKLDGVNVVGYTSARLIDIIATDGTVTSVGLYAQNMTLKPHPEAVTYRLFILKHLFLLK